MSEAGVRAVWRDRPFDETRNDDLMIDQIFAILNEFGHVSYGEEITQMEHALQCGFFARADGASDALVAAALLHDMGQFIDDAGNAAVQKGIDARHETTGAAFLAACFPHSVTEPIRLHVAAKRYLCAIEAGYEASLSGASRLSLHLQGGAMTEAEVSQFESTEYFTDAIHLRRYDDQGKRPHWVGPALETYRPLLESLVTTMR